MALNTNRMLVFGDAKIPLDIRPDFNGSQ
jgi:hypothetical protein